MPQSVLNYIERNRAGLVRSLVETALQASGYKIEALETPEVALLRRRLELHLMLAVGFSELREPPESLLEGNINVRGEAPAGPDSIEVDSEKSAPVEEPELPGNPDVEVHPPPPPLRKRR